MPTSTGVGFLPFAYLCDWGGVGAGWGFRFSETGFLCVAQTAVKLKDLQPSTAETTGAHNPAWCIL